MTKEVISLYKSELVTMLVKLNQTPYKVYQFL